MADNTILQGYWCFDKSIAVGGGIDYGVEFTFAISGTKYNGTRIYTNSALGLIYQDSDGGVHLVYDTNVYGGWYDESSKTIVIGNGGTTNLLNWLQDNASKVEVDFDGEYETVPEYLANISQLQSQMNALIVSQGGTLKYKSLEQYMQSLVDLRKKFVEMLQSANVVVDESQKMSSAWVEKFNEVIFNIVKGYDLTNLEIVDDVTTEIKASVTSYGVPRIKKLTFNKLQYINNSIYAFDGCIADEVWFNALKGIQYNKNDAQMQGAKFKVVHMPVANQSGSSVSVHLTRLFSGNTYIEELYLDNTLWLGQHMCNNCTSLTKIYAPMAKFSNGAFKGCTSLENVDLPLMEELSSYEFQNCKKLKNVNMPNLKYIAGYAFDGCTSLESITLDNTTNLDQECFRNCTSLISIDIPKVDKVSQRVFYGCTSLKTATIKDNSTLDGNAFYGCTSLHTINGKIGYLNSAVFYGCQALENIDTSETTYLGAQAFYNCTSLKRIEITQIMRLEREGGQFYGCTALERAILSGITYWYNNGSSQFRNCTSLTFVDLRNCTYLDSSNTGIYMPFNGCTALNTVILGVSSIMEGTFSNCTALTDLYLGYEGRVSLSSTNAFTNVGTADAPLTVHVRADYVDQYATATNWSSLINNGRLVVVGDYTDELIESLVNEEVA